MAFCLVCLWKLIILFPPAKYDFNAFVSLNASVSKANNKRSDRGEPSSYDLKFFIDWYVQLVNIVIFSFSQNDQHFFIFSS